jgi:hypothetical protein
MFIKPGEQVSQRDQETMHDFTVRIALGDGPVLHSVPQHIRVADARH